MHACIPSKSVRVTSCAHEDEWLLKKQQKSLGLNPIERKSKGIKKKMNWTKSIIRNPPEPMRII